MPRLATPLSDLKCRTAKPRDRAYKLFDGGGMYLYDAPSGSKTWRLRYFKPNGKEGTLIIGKYPIVSLAVARTKRDEAKALLLDNLDPMEEKQKAKMLPSGRVFSLKLSLWSGTSKCPGAGPRATPRRC